MQHAQETIDRSPEAIARRRTAARSMAGSMEIEGSILTEEEKAVTERYILGEISVDELRKELLALP